MMQSKCTFPLSVFRLALLFSSVFAVLLQPTGVCVLTLRVASSHRPALKLWGRKTVLKPTSCRPRGVFGFLDHRVLLVVVLHGFDLGCLGGDCVLRAD